MSTVRAITQLEAAKARSQAKIDAIQKRAATDIMLEEERIKTVDNALVALKGASEPVT